MCLLVLLFQYLGRTGSTVKTSPVFPLLCPFFVFIPAPEDFDHVSSVNSYPIFSMGLLSQSSMTPSPHHALVWCRNQVCGIAHQPLPPLLIRSNSQCLRNTVPGFYEIAQRLQLSQR